MNWQQLALLTRWLMQKVILVLRQPRKIIVIDSTLIQYIQLRQFPFYQKFDLHMWKIPVANGTPFCFHENKAAPEALNWQLFTVIRFPVQLIFFEEFLDFLVEYFTFRKFREQFSDFLIAFQGNFNTICARFRKVRTFWLNRRLPLVFVAFSIEKSFIGFENAFQCS